MKVDARERSSPASSLRIRLLVGLAALLACGPCEAWQQTDTPASQCAGVLRSIPHALVTEAWGVEAAATRVLDLLDCSGITVRVPAPGDAAAANALPSFPEVRLEEAHASVIGSLATLLQDMPRDHAHLVPPLRELLQVARGRCEPRDRSRQTAAHWMFQGRVRDAFALEGCQLQQTCLAPLGSLRMRGAYLQLDQAAAPDLGPCTCITRACTPAGSSGSSGN